MASAEPLAMADFRRLADYEDDDIAAALAALREEWQTRGFRLVEVADGWQFISGDGYMEYLRRLRPQKNGAIVAAIDGSIGDYRLSAADNAR